MYSDDYIKVNQIFLPYRQFANETEHSARVVKNMRIKVYNNRHLFINVTSRC